ncbi:MAG: hypothetical protein BWY12_00225 [candidate division BRC1 bacterium ADurb.Bin183]|nr:MAG: hypothetical protein BWY12_00225 [candidate division BRC1 bacterium ADurb.Bin183]
MGEGGGIWAWHAARADSVNKSPADVLFGSSSETLSLNGLLIYSMYFINYFETVLRRK